MALAGADDAGGEHEPVADVAYFLVEQIDSRTECQQWAHHALLGRVIDARRMV